MKYPFVREHRDRLPVVDLCRLLEVSASGFYRWLDRPRNAAAMRRERVAAKIRAINPGVYCAYGSTRMMHELVDHGEKLCRNTVARVMREHDLLVRPPKPFRVRTTDSNHHLPIARDLIQGVFAASEPNRLWLADITYVPTDEGWLYLAGLMDMYSRFIVGWKIGASMDAGLTLGALRMALGRRAVRPGLIHHSDRGSQYASREYRGELRACGALLSMSSATENCYGNAAKESVWGRLKTELVYRRRYATLEAARMSIFEYLEGFYNLRRRHSGLGYVSPKQFEERSPALRSSTAIVPRGDRREPRQSPPPQSVRGGRKTSGRKALYGMKIKPSGTRE